MPNGWTPLDVAMEVEVQSGSENFANMREGMATNSLTEYLKTLNGTNNANYEKTKTSSKGSLVVNFFLYSLVSLF